MQANILNQRNVFEYYFPPILQGLDLVALSKKVAAAVISRFSERQFEQQYLAGATSIIDLERRMFQLQYARYELPRWIW